MSSHARIDAEAFEDDTMRAWAYVCRYGHIPLSEAGSLDRRDLQDFAAALAQIVREEQPK